MQRKIPIKIAQILFSAMHITDQKLSFNKFTEIHLPNSNDFWHKTENLSFWLVQCNLWLFQKYTLATGFVIQGLTQAYIYFIIIFKCTRIG